LLTEFTIKDRFSPVNPFINTPKQSTSQASVLINKALKRGAMHAGRLYAIVVGNPTFPSKALTDGVYSSEHPVPFGFMLRSITKS
jgi:hypothetical protein